MKKHGTYRISVDVVIRGREFRGEGVYDRMPTAEEFLDLMGVDARSNEAYSPGYTAAVSALVKRCGLPSLPAELDPPVRVGTSFLYPDGRITVERSWSYALDEEA